MAEQYVYIARVYERVDSRDSQRIDLEAAFLSFEEARDYLNSLWHTCPDDLRAIGVTTQIVAYAIGEPDSVSRQWIYNGRGELLQEKALAPRDCKDLVQNRMYQVEKGPETGEYPEFKRGDIVLVSPEHDIYGWTHQPLYGVVHQPFEENRNNPEIGCVVYVVAEDGRLSHVHVYDQKHMRHAECDLPEEYVILRFLALGFENNPIISEEVLYDICRYPVDVVNGPRFDFKSFSIVEPVPDAELDAALKKVS